MNTATANSNVNSWNPVNTGFTDPIMVISGIIATIIHLVLLFFITFATPVPSDATMKDVTIAVHLVKNQKVTDADYLAQSSALGAGLLRTAHRLTNPEMSEEQSLQMDMINPNASSRAAKAAEAASSEHHILSTTLSWDKQQAEKGKKTARQKQESEQSVNSTAAMVATLEAEYALTKQEYAKKSTIHTVDSVSAQADPSAPYLNEFRSIVEKVGNRYYPEEAKVQHLAGDVRLMVLLNPNGEVQAIHLLSSSGSKVLDEAAKASVRYGAPYPKFDAAMQGFSQLRIIRTWRFTPENSMPEVIP